MRAAIPFKCTLIILALARFPAHIFPAITYQLRASLSRDHGSWLMNDHGATARSLTPPSRRADPHDAARDDVGDAAGTIPISKARMRLTSSVEAPCSSFIIFSALFTFNSSSDWRSSFAGRLPRHQHFSMPMAARIADTSRLATSAHDIELLRPEHGRRSFGRRRRIHRQGFDAQTGKSAAAHFARSDTACCLPRSPHVPMAHTARIARSARCNGIADAAGAIIIIGGNALCARTTLPYYRLFMNADSQGFSCGTGFGDFDFAIFSLTKSA